MTGGQAVNSSSDILECFHSQLLQYINSGGCLSRLDILASTITKAAIFEKHSKQICHQYQSLCLKRLHRAGAPVKVPVEVYEGKNPHVFKMMAYLEKYLNDDLVGAYVHGSLGTYEEIAYSDFDALIILKNEVFQSPKRLVTAARKLNAARSIMFDFDPLQHHGWFVLTEADLRYYCNSYFPVELFSHAKSLFDDKGLELQISLRESNYETRRAFEEMADAIIQRIKRRQYPMNIYQLKSLLSQFMLLPALYIQARDERGIYKKESFKSAKVEFDSADWTIMDKVSEIRSNWNYRISGFRRWIMSRPSYLSRYVAKKLAPKIPKGLNDVLTPKFYSEIEKLVLLMKENSPGNVPN